MSLFFAATDTVDSTVTYDLPELVVQPMEEVIEINAVCDVCGRDDNEDLLLLCDNIIGTLHLSIVSCPSTSSLYRH
jgi:hypothetical protein